MRMSRKAVLKSAVKKLPLGTTWVFDEVGSTTFTVEQTGYYDIELHGGGGGSGASSLIIQQFPSLPPAWGSVSGGGGGGSGEIYSNVFLTKGTSYTLVIGAGGAGSTDSGASGGQTKFGTLYTVNGGGGGGWGGDPPAPGVASGSLATAGEEGYFLGGQGTTPHPTSSRAGGQGNKNNISQTYGDGGSSPASPYPNPGFIPGNRGQDGAIILTLKSY